MWGKCHGGVPQALSGARASRMDESGGGRAAAAGRVKKDKAPGPDRIPPEEYKIYAKECEKECFGADE